MGTIQKSQFSTTNSNEFLISTKNTYDAIFRLAVIENNEARYYGVRIPATYFDILPVHIPIYRTQVYDKRKTWVMLFRSFMPSY